MSCANRTRDIDGGDSLDRDAAGDRHQVILKSGTVMVARGNFTGAACEELLLSPAGSRDAAVPGCLIAREDCRVAGLGMGRVFRAGVCCWGRVFDRVCGSVVIYSVMVTRRVSGLRTLEIVF